MKILNMGLPEIILVGAIMLIFLGPQGMKESARKLGILIRRVIRSDAWRSFNAVYSQVKDFPEQIIQEAKLEELRETLKNPPDISFPTVPELRDDQQNENSHKEMPHE